jgi:DNA topoisomerase-1
MAHISADWWDIRGPFVHGEGDIEAHLTQWKGSPIVTGRNFSAQGKLKSKGLVLLGEAEVKAAVKALNGGSAKVSGVDERPYVDRPAPPFTTSTMQQEANRRFKWAARKTMNTAQRL